MSQDVTDDAGLPPTGGKKDKTRQRAMSIEALHSEMMPVRKARKESACKAIRTLLNALRLRKCASADISTPDPTYKVAYLGNVVTGWAKGDGCVEKPLATLWRNYTQSSRGDVKMQLTVSGGGLRATTKDHGLTEYWAHRLTCCAAPAHFPRLFCWVYRHEGRRLRHELRCHAVLCASATVAKQIETHLKNSLAQALAEFKRDKISKQNARLSIVNCIYENPTIPRRKILLSTGSHNYRPPLERSKSAPKLTMIEENLEEDEDYFEGMARSAPMSSLEKTRLMRHYDSTTSIFCPRSEKSKGLHRLRFCQRAKPIKVMPRMPNSELEELNELKEDEELYNHNEADVLVPEEEEDEDDNDKNQLILEDFETDLLESCKQHPDVQQWFNNLNTDTSDLLPLDSDEGSLSSGCESASTVTSDLDQAPYIPIPEIHEVEENSSTIMNSSVIENSSPNTNPNSRKKTEPDFKVGESVLARVCSLERLTTNAGKYCGLAKVTKHSLMNGAPDPAILDPDEVSLVPVGETQSDFSSLKVFKKRVTPCKTTSSGGFVSESDRDFCTYEVDEQEGGSENGSACSDESGYDELLDCNSSVSNIVLV